MDGQFIIGTFYTAQKSLFETLTSHFGDTARLSWLMANEI